MTDEEQAMLEVAFANGVAAKAAWQSLFAVAAAESEESKRIILAALFHATSRLQMDAATVSESLRGPVARAADQVRRYRDALSGLPSDGDAPGGEPGNG